MDTRDLSVIIYTLWPWYNGFGLMCVTSFNIFSRKKKWRRLFVDTNFTWFKCWKL